MAQGDSSRLALLSSLTDDLSRTLVRDPRREWTAGQILGAAATLHPRFASGKGPIGIACAQPGWLLASLVAAWGANRPAILLDPGLKKELESLYRLFPGLPVFADRGEPGDGRVLISEELTQCVAATSVPSWLTVPGDDDPFAGLFTSGSEGGHKVIDKRGRQFYRQAAAIAELLALAPGCRVLSFVPGYHLLGFFYGIVLPLIARGQTVVATELTGVAMAQLLAKYTPDLAVGTATHYRFLVRAPATASPAPSPKTRYLSSGAPLDPAAAEAFAARFGTPVREFYGSTELGGVAWRAWPEPYQAMPGVRWRIDAETGRLEVQSPWSGAAGETWVPTDDAAELSGDQRFTLLGRLSHMVKVGAKRFSSVEVEQALRAMPGVAEVAVVPYDRYGEQAIAAFIAAEPGVTLTDEAVRAFLAERLAAFKRPRTLCFLAQLPRGSHEKVDYAALRKLLTTGP